MNTLPPLWAIHIADGVLSPSWLLAGWLIAGLLTAVAAWRVREEEVPRVALLTAAFFVASSIHVKLGPTSVHLLLGGLVGVLLGRRAPLAILIGVVLQALLVAHGGLATAGVNAAVQAVPALLAGGLFGLLRGWTAGGQPIRQEVVIAAGACLWGLCLALGLCAVLVNPWRDAVRLSPDAGLVISVVGLRRVQELATHPLALGLLGVFVLGCVAAARRLRVALAFPAGALAGLVGVLGTLLLAGAVLLLDGADRWGSFVNVVFLAHLPLALIEAGIVGATVGFLSRVQPDLVGMTATSPAVKVGPAVPPLLALAALLLHGPDAAAHALKVDPSIDWKTKQVTVEAHYEAGEVPEMATVRVLRGDGGVVAEGLLDERGIFRFHYAQAEPLRVEVTAPGGHRATLRLSPRELGAAEPSAEPKPAAVAENSRWRDLIAGVAFVLALGAFVLGLLNARTLRRLDRQRESTGR